MVLPAAFLDTLGARQFVNPLIIIYHFSTLFALWLLPKKPAFLSWTALGVYVYAGALQLNHYLPTPSQEPLLYITASILPWVVILGYSIYLQLTKKWESDTSLWSERIAFYPVFWVPLFVIFKTDPSWMALILLLYSLGLSLFQGGLTWFKHRMEVTFLKLCTVFFHLLGILFLTLLLIETLRPPLLQIPHLSPPLGNYFIIFPFNWIPYLWIPLGMYLHCTVLSSLVLQKTQKLSKNHLL